jgi:hypothetical protein
MNILWGALIIAGVALFAVTAMLLVRRRAPEGSYFSDGDRASGVFGVLATGFSVLLGLVVFLAFTSFDQSRVGAEEEALVLRQQLETAQFFPDAVADELTGQVICYARAVVYVEWPRAEAGILGSDINPWGLAMFQAVEPFQPQTASEETAHGKWLDQTFDRESARTDRIHGAVGVIPTPLWVVLGLISCVIFVFMLFFADRAERAVTQAMLMGSVASVIAAMLLLIHALDSPFKEGVGGLRPTAMERTLDLMDEALAAVDREVEPPCDAEGRPSA